MTKRHKNNRVLDGYSIVLLLLRGLALVGEVVGVILLSVPSLLGVEDVETPAHHLAGLER